MTSRIKNIAALLLASTSFISMSGAAFAGEAEDAVIAKVVDAYGGKKLENLRSIRITDNIKNAGFGQGWSSGYVELAAMKQDVQLDLRGEKMHGEFFSAQPSGGFHNAVVVNDDGVTAMNYLNGTYGPGAQADYYGAAGASIRTSDTLLAYELQKRADTAEHQGTVHFQGQVHDLITFETPSSPPLTLYVNAESGLIRKMTRETPFGDLTYQFPIQTEANGIAYAPGFDFYVGDEPISITTSRTVTINNVRDSVFTLDDRLSPAPEVLDTSEMSAAEISDGLHLVGSGIGYTLFAETNDGVVAVGGYAGLQDRVTHYREIAGHEKPLTHQIVTHHHTDHLGGMGDAFTLGAIFVTPEAAIANLRNAVGEEIPEDRLVTLSDIGKAGPFDIFVVPTSHVEAIALAYHPDSKTIFQVDHYNSNQVDGFSPGNVNTASLKAAIDKLDIEVDHVLSGHGPVIVPWVEFTRIASEVGEDRCPSKRPICS